MTDEEKTEEYIKGKLCFLCKEEKSKSKCATCSTFLTAYICYLDGLTDGREEKCNSCGLRQQKRINLAKENAELLDKLNLQNQRLNELKKENEQLKCDLYNTNANLQHITIELEKEELNRDKTELTNSVTELKSKVTELEMQIEKMKSFVKSMYEANKNDAYCKEYLGTILNEWELDE